MSLGLPGGFFQRPETVTVVRALDFGRLFRLVRDELGISQEALGLALELDQSRICKLETGAQRLRDVQTVARVATVLGIPAHLLGFAEDPDRTGTGDEMWADSDRRAFLTTATTLALTAPLGPVLWISPRRVCTGAMANPF